MSAGKVNVAEFLTMFYPNGVGAHYNTVITSWLHLISDRQVFENDDDEDHTVDIVRLRAKRKRPSS